MNSKRKGNTVSTFFHSLHSKPVRWSQGMRNEWALGPLYIYCIMKEKHRNVDTLCISPVFNVMDFLRRIFFHELRKANYCLLFFVGSLLHRGEPRKRLTANGAFIYRSQPTPGHITYNWFVTELWWVLSVIIDL